MMSDTIDIVVGQLRRIRGAGGTFKESEAAFEARKAALRQRLENESAAAATYRANNPPEPSDVAADPGWVRMQKDLALSQRGARFINGEWRLSTTPVDWDLATKRVVKVIIEDNPE